MKSNHQKGKALYYILGIVALIAIGVFLAFLFTSGVTKEADAFFEKVKAGKIEEAYNSTAEAFRKATSFKEFEYFLNVSGLSDFQKATWTERSVQNNMGKLKGSIEIKGGVVIPLEITFVKESGRWKILGIKKRSAGLVEAEKKSSKKIPGINDLITMTSNALLVLGDGINHRDFSDFYNFIAKVWQRETSPQELQAAFQAFIDKGIDLTIIKNENPVFSENPYIQKNGVLILKGYYPTKPYMVNFELGFVYEYPEWKLVSIKVSTE